MWLVLSHARKVKSSVFPALMSLIILVLDKWQPMVTFIKRMFQNRVKHKVYFEFLFFQGELIILQIEKFAFLERMEHDWVIIFHHFDNELFDLLHWLKFPVGFLGSWKVICSSISTSTFTCSAPERVVLAFLWFFSFRTGWKPLPLGVEVAMVKRLIAQHFHEDCP